MGSMPERPPMFPTASRGRAVLLGALICVRLPEGEVPQAGAELAAGGPAGAVGGGGSRGAVTDPGGVPGALGPAGRRAGRAARPAERSGRFGGEAWVMP
jgi:hypothetical protein